jgi:hypothetical protein
LCCSRAAPCSYGRRGGFVGYDDPVYVARNGVQSGLTPRNVWAFTSFDAANWHPLTWLSHMLDVICWASSGAQHLVNAQSPYQRAAARRLFRMTGAFALRWQPRSLRCIRCVESVAWIAERKDVLAAMFWMLTLLAYQSYVAARRAAISGCALPAA